MKCSYYEDIINYDEGSLNTERAEQIKKHIQTCEECRSFLGALIISRKYIANEPKMDKYFYMKVLDAVDKNRYKNNKTTYKLLHYIGKLKPAFGAIAAVFVVVLLINFSRFFGGINVPYTDKTKDNSEYSWNVDTNLDFLKTKGQNIVTSKGEIFRIKGVTLTNNFWGNWVDGVSEKLQSEGKDPVIRPAVQDSWVLTEEDFERIKSLGCNTILYDINYQLFAEDNPDRADNVEKLKSHISRFSEMDIYTAVMLMAPPGLDSANDIYEMYRPGPDRIKSVFEDDTYYSQWVSMWKFLANELKDFKGVAGYGIINQPRVPANEEGGIEIFNNRLNNVCKEIRKIDKNHIIFVPEYNSREANPGESYHDSKTNSLKVEAGEQGVIWERGLVKVSTANVVYLFHFFEPYDFVNNGIGNFDASILEEQVENRANWAKEIGNAPLMTEYGVSRVNSMDQRLKWLETVHSIYNKYSISASYFQYKTSTGAYVDMKTGFNPIYGEYINWDREITLKDGSYVFNYEEAAKTAKDNNFVEVLEEFYLKNNSIETVSLLDNKLLLDKLKEFWE
ncbi:MAG: cellulase family glycosylhydrolase [Clostridiaceae bacterium]|nr:cellulase family glycosylhydrolase [Clostridiaceae bacterium]